MTFYKLEVSREQKLIEASEDNDFEPITCEKDPGHQRAGRRVTPLHIDILVSKPVDFSGTMLGDIVISEHARQVLSAAKLTGFTVAKVEVATRLEQFDDSLWEFVVTGRGGPAHKDSGVKKLRACSECGLVEYSAFDGGIAVDMSRYDGSDFFAVDEYPKYILVSERAKSVIKAGGLTNVTFVESTKLEWPKGVVKPK